MFKTIQRNESLTVRIVNEIEEAIRKKILPVNHKLPSEKELCDQFEVSKSILREALKILCGMGLLNIKKGKGVFVNEITSESISNHIERYLVLKYEKDNILDMYNVREVIEPNIVVSAALNRTDDDIENLKINMKKFCDFKIDFNQRSYLDGEFHSLISRATKNTYLPLIMEPVYNVMYEIRKAVYPNIKESRNSAELWHKKILQSIINKDTEKARSYIIRHLEISRKHATKWLNAKSEEK